MSVAMSKVILRSRRIDPNMPNLPNLPKDATIAIGQFRVVVIIKLTKIRSSNC